MKQLITKECTNQIQFFQTPKAFFNNPKYMPMRSESKHAYMLMMDLVPLSIKNNWVNKEGEIFVKISRSKLMMLLNIKGTQKAAQVMQELVDLGLIVYKKVGLTKCNEIYLYPPEELKEREEEKDSTNDLKIVSLEETKTNHMETETQTHIKTNYTKTNINQSVNQSYKETQNKVNNKKKQESDRQNDRHVETFVNDQSLVQDIAVVNRLLENQIYIEELKAQYDQDFVEEIANNISEMYLNTTTRIGGQDKPRTIMQGVINKLKTHHIEHVIEQFEKVTAECEIRNIKGYIQTMIYNSIYEASTKVKGHIKYNFGY